MKKQIYLSILTSIFLVLLILISTPTIAGTDENMLTAKAIDIPRDIHFSFEKKESFNAYVKQFQKIDCIDYKELRTFLQPTPTIKDTARRLTSGMDNDRDIVYALHSFVYNTITYELVDETLPPEQILREKRGDCTEKSLLFSSMLEAEGIHSYVVDGGDHWYVFAEIGGSWLPIDPTQDFYFAYHNWNKTYASKYYDTQKNIQPFMLDRTSTLFNQDWCQDS